jgi:hypothetical protein
MLPPRRPRKHPPPSRLTWPHVYLVLATAYLVLTAGYAYLGYLDNPGDRIRGNDSVYYYIYLRSACFDGDLDFTNEWTHYYGASEARPSAQNVFSVGPAILWSPLFLLGHLATLLARALGSEVALDGYSGLYQGFVYIGNSVYGLLGVALTALFLKKRLGARESLIACLGVMLGSQLTYYLWPFTATSHNVSFVSTALFLYLWSRSGAGKLTGVAAGLMCLVRWQNALFLLIPAVRCGIDLAEMLRNRSDGYRGWLTRYGSFGAIVLCGLLPQLVAWHVVYGRFVLIPQGSGFLDFSDLDLVPVLFSLRHGLFSWHPLLSLGLAGCALLWRVDRALTISLGGVLVCQWVLNAAVTDWWAGWSFGARRFVNLLPAFALGLGLIAGKLRGWTALAGFGIVLLAGVWNQLFVYQYMRGLIPRGGALTYQEMLPDKFSLRRVGAAQLAASSAVKRLNDGDIEGFNRHAALAHRYSPDYRNSLLVYSLKCLSSGDDQETLDVFRRWHERRPGDMIARWGLAESLARQGAHEQAEALFASGIAGGDALAGEVRARIDRGETSLIDARFYEMYTQRLRDIRLE